MPRLSPFPAALRKTPAIVLMVFDLAEEDLRTASAALLAGVPTAWIRPGTESIQRVMSTFHARGNNDDDVLV